MQDILGLRLVKCAVKEKSLDIAQLHSLSINDVYDVAKAAWGYCVEFLTQQGDWPELHVVEEKVGFKFPDFDDNYTWVANEVRQRSLAKNLREYFETAAEMLQENNPDGAFSALKETIFKLQGISDVGKKYIYRDTFESRFKIYEDRKAGKFDGVPCPWDTIQQGTMGFANGTLTSILARTNTGKSWTCCHISNHVASAGKKVLLATLETPSMSMGRRIDSLHFKLPFQGVLTGRLPEAFEDKWRVDITYSDPAKTDIVIVDKKSIRRVSDLIAVTYEVQPDIVIVDGAYRLEASGQTKGAWEATKQIVDNLQLAAETTNVPWVITSQYGADERGGTEHREGQPMRSNAAKYGKEFAINVDMCLGIQHTRAQRDLKVMELHVIKLREGAGISIPDIIYLNWKLDPFPDFSEIKDENSSDQSDFGEVDY